MSCNSQTTRNTNVATNVLRHQLAHKVEIVATRIEIDISLQPFRVVEILHRSRGFCLKGRRQLQVQVGETEVLHVATHHSIDLQLLVRPLLAETCRHGTHEAHEVLLAQRSVDGALERSWIQVGEGVEAHIEIGLEG